VTGRLSAAFCRFSAFILDVVSLLSPKNIVKYFLFRKTERIQPKNQQAYLLGLSRRRYRRMVD